MNQGSARSHTQQSLGSNGADDGPDTHTVAREVIAPLSGGPSSVSPDTQSTSAAAVSTPGLPLAIKPAQRDAAVPESGERTLPPDVIAQPSEALPPTPAVYSARVMERAGQSEMHVGVNSSDFGPIEVHAMVSHDRVGASISSGHPDLRTAIQMEMPSLNRAMESHQLRLEHFDVNARSGGQGGHTFTDDQQRRFHDRQFTTRFTRADEAASLLRQTEGSRWIAPHSARLSVIA